MFKNHKSKGIGVIFVLSIILVFAAISIFIFLTLFTYTINIVRVQTISKSRDSLIPLVLVNSRYLDNNNLAISLAIDADTTKEDITKIVKDLSHIGFPVTGPPYPGTQPPTRICYKYSFGNIEDEIEWFNCEKKYTSRMVFPFPQIFDGKDFIVEGVFESYMK